MTLPKNQSWLIPAAALLVLPVVLASYWMMSGDPIVLNKEAPAYGGAPGDEVASGNAGLGASPTGGMADLKAEADDFRGYAERLKAQGQPEKTVRELVASRITAAFEAKRAVIRSQARRAGANALDVQAQLDGLSREQGALITQLVGADDLPATMITANAAGGIPGTGREKQVLMPAVMAEMLPATVKTEAQAAAWEKLRNDFVISIGGENQDPADPHYRKRWVQAESANDQRFRLLYGDTAYVQHQMQAQHEAMLKAQRQTKQ